MKIILIPLSILIFIMLLTQAHAHSTFNTTNSFTPNGNDIQGEQQLNGTGTQYKQATEYGTFSPDALNGILAVAIAISAVMAVVGIRIVGSGISETSVQILYKTIFFYSIWGICSVFALNGFSNDGLLSMPYNFGSIIYFIMTLFYSIGIVQQVGTSTGGMS